jgi:hypothetical protein
MQIKLKKYFMIFLGATLVSTSGKRERNLDHIKRRISMQACQNPLFVSEIVLTFCLIVSAHQSGAPIFSSLSAVCLSCSTNTAHISRTLPL